MPKKLKVAQVEAQSGPGLLDRYDISGPLNAKLYALQKRSNEISRITYITNTRTGEITSAIVEYYHRSQKKKNNSTKRNRSKKCTAQAGAFLIPGKEDKAQI